jgi:hypothetical protein
LDVSGHCGGNVEGNLSTPPEIVTTASPALLGNRIGLRPGPLWRFTFVSRRPVRSRSDSPAPKSEPEGKRDILRQLQLHRGVFAVQYDWQSEQLALGVASCDIPELSEAIAHTI